MVHVMYFDLESSLRRYPWIRVEPPDKLMVAMSRNLKGAGEDERRRIVNESLDHNWRDLSSDDLLDAWKAIVCFRCEFHATKYTKLK